jgi:MFS superfamily sulfate permease-like transporter
MTDERTKSARPAAGPESLPLDEAVSSGGWLANSRHDILASVVVFLVALPLCMGIAIASGVPVAAGLITGIVGGIVVGAVAGCPLQVSGPAAGLTVIVYEVVQRFGLEMLGIVVLISGAIQVVAGALKLGQWFRAVSPAVIKGMLAGIGILIFASQFHVMVDDKPKGNGLTNLVTIPAAIAKAIAWPDFGTPASRRARTDAMREIGELHRRQAAIAERIVEQLPEVRIVSPPEANLAPHRIEGLDATIVSLREDQQALTDDVEAAIARLEARERPNGDGSRSQRILRATPLALATSRAASEDLIAGRVSDVLKSQQAAESALAEVLDSQKNHFLAAQVGILTIAIILLWPAIAPRKLKVLPGPLIAILISSGLAAAVHMPVLYVEVPDSLWSELHFPTAALLAQAPWKELLQSALVIAVVASAETLLCATAVDQMQQGPRTKYDQELAAQGVGNIVCGCLGALPMTGVIVRSTANVQSGGTTRLSAILHGVWLLVFVVFLGFLLRLIPTSALAAILVYTGYKLVNPKSIGELRKYGWGEVAIYLATVVTIVVTDLLTGVLFGVVLAAAKLLYTFSHLETGLIIDEPNRRAVLTLAGAATFVRLPMLATELESVPASSELHVDFQRLDYIDHACLDLLMNWAKQHETTGGKLVLDWESLHARFRAGEGSRAERDAARPTEQNTTNGAGRPAETIR